jgi:hypothetical protein
LAAAAPEQAERQQQAPQQAALQQEQLRQEVPQLEAQALQQGEALRQLAVGALVVEEGGPVVEGLLTKVPSLHGWPFQSHQYPAREKTRTVLRSASRNDSPATAARSSDLSCISVHTHPRRDRSSTQLGGKEQRGVKPAQYEGRKEISGTSDAAPSHPHTAAS